ncbi:MAG: DUF2853 family protein [Pseudomonadota bacterium]
MSDKAEKIAKFKAEAEEQLAKVGESTIDDAELQALADSMKMVIENRDALYVAGTDDSELETVQRNFIAKKMGISDKDKGMEIARAVAAKMSDIKMKNRAAFYYLCKKHG